MRTLARSLRRVFLLSREDRMMLYTLLAAQLRAGIVPATACRELATLQGLPSGIVRAAKAAAQAAREGRTEIEGLAATGLIPADELALLHTGSRAGQLRTTLDELVARQDTDRGFLGQVLVPNLYLITVVSVLTGFVMTSEDYFANLNVFNAAANPLFEMARTLKVWLPWGLGGFGAAVGVGIWGANNWTGRSRRGLLVFDTLARLQFGLRFAQMAERLSLRGVAATETLETLQTVYPGSRYLTYHARQALLAIRGGELWETALGRGLLLPQHATLLRGLVPGSAVKLYPAGYRGLIEIQRQILERLFRRLRIFVRMGLLLVILFLFFQLVQGLYTMIDSSNLTGSGY